MTDSRDDQRIILELIRSADTPLTAKQVAQKWLNSSRQKEVRRVQNLLEELRSAGRTFEFPPEKEGFSKRFWSVSPLEFVCGRILRLVQDSGGRITQQGGRAALNKWETEYFDQAIGKLVREKKLFYLTVRYKFLVSERPTPFDHLLQRQVTALREILERVNRHRVSRLSMDELKALLNGLETEGSVRITEEILRKWYDQDVSRRGGVKTVPLSWTWERYDVWCKSNKVEPDLKGFHDSFLQLQRAGKIELMPHDRTQELSKRELELSLRTRYGEVLYYWRWA